MLDDFEGRLATVGAKDAVALCRQDELEALSECFVIIDDQDPTKHFEAPFRSRRPPGWGTNGFPAFSSVVGMIE
jgi:hypothetical protein